MRGRTKCNQAGPVLPSLVRVLQLAGAGCFALLLSACGSPSATPAATVSTVSTGIVSDMAVAQALYFDQRIPGDFYQENTEGGNYTTVSHVRNIDLVPAINRSGMQVVELATDNADEALAWSEQAASLNVSYRQLTDISETFLYYQFTRVDPASPQLVTYNRVFKASVLDRNGVTDDYLGRITLADISAQQVKQIVEYLWLFTNDNNYGNAVLTSSTSQTVSGFEHVMQQARLTTAYNGSCDTIELYEVRYTIARDSGFIRRQQQLSRVISARRSGSQVEICSL